MKSCIAYVAQAVNVVFSSKRYKVGFLIASVFFLGLFIYLPVLTTPGNDVLFQLSIFSLKDYILLITLSLVTALSLSLNFFVILRQFTSRDGVSLAVQGGGGSISAVLASIFGTASCSTCVGPLFSFLGFGGILLLLKYRTVIALAVIALMFLSLYFTSKRVLGICKIRKK